MQPEEALQYYRIEGAVKSIAPFGLGHINDTYQVDLDDRSLLLQKINTGIFQQPQILEENLKAALKTAPELFAFHLKTIDDHYHLISNEQCWRLQEFVPGSYAPQVVEEVKMAFQIGAGFGEFMSEMSSISGDLVKESIPNFHHLGLRIDRFREVVSLNLQGRNQKVPELIDKAFDYSWIWQEFEKLVAAGLPQRICHNDTKSNNILLSKKTNEFLKVIDLDTLGPGYAFFDYGDMVRSMATHGHEGDRDVIGRPLQLDLIKANKEGYLSTCAHVLNQHELDTLDFGSLFMTYFTGIRMLTDFLVGDIYYRIHEWDDNLIRSSNQFYVLDLLSQHLKK